MTSLQLWDGTRNTWTCTNWKTIRVSWTPNCMLSLGLTRYEMELGFSDLFTSYEMELETHGCMYILKTKYSFVNTNLHAITRVDQLCHETRLSWPLYKLSYGTTNTWTCTYLKPTRALWTPICMLSLGLTSYEMQIGFSGLFTSYEMELVLLGFYP